MNRNELDKEWLREIRFNLSEAPMKAPADGWEKISATLQTEKTAKRHRINAYLLHVAAAITSLLGIGFVFTILNEQTNNLIIEKNVASTEHLTRTEKIETPKMRSLQTIISPKSAIITERLESTDTIKNNETENKSLDNGEVYKITEEEQKTAIDELYNEEEKTILVDMGNTKNAAKNRRWNLGLSMGGSREIGNKEENRNMLPNTSEGGYGAHDPLNTRRILSSNNHWSWNIGLSVRRQLSKRLSIESGLSYTLLSSDVTIGISEHENTKAERLNQKLHYLGIPLSLNITLQESQRWQLYASAGGMAEHSIAASLGGNSFAINAWQWSVNGAIGGQYNVSKYLGIYLEPRINYYFDDHTGIQSIRTESPCNLSLRIGLRLSY